jgi:hypothetical protein
VLAARNAAGSRRQRVVAIPAGDVAAWGYRARVPDETVSCGYCGQPFPAPARRRGPTPRYCCPAHRQRAHQQRQRDRATTAPATDPAQVEMLEATVAGLHRQLAMMRQRNARLRHELERLRDELNRVGTPEPTSPTMRRLAGLEPLPAPDPEPRGWRTWLHQRRS